MSDKLIYPNRQFGLTRRALLQAGAGAVRLLEGGTSVLHAQDKSVSAVMPTVGIPEPAKAMIERQDRHPDRAHSLCVADRHGRQAVRAGRHLPLRLHGHQLVFRAQAR